VAKHLSDDSFALIFGINTLVAVLIQTLLTILVISETGFALDPRGQFFVYGSYFVALAIVYGIKALLNCVLIRKVHE
jgi:solute carrier family 19 (thiamine transporter), member 2/3